MPSSSKNRGAAAASASAAVSVAGRTRARVTGTGTSGGQKRKSSSEEATTTTTPTTNNTPKNNIMNVAINNDSIIKLKTAKECALKWSNLLSFVAGRRKQHLQFTAAATTTAKDNYESSSIFDCSDLIIPPASELINLEVAKGIQRWEDLASRVIVGECEGDDEYNEYGEMEDDNCVYNNGDVEEREINEEEKEGINVPKLRNREQLLDAATRGDKRKQRLLPLNFDYACKTDGPRMGDVSGEEFDAMAVLGDEGGDSGHKKQKRSQQQRYRPRVISLLDPTQTCDYEEELWKVFRSVKTLDELEWIHALGKRKGPLVDDENNVDSSTNIPQHGCQYTLAVKDNMKEWFAKYSRMDAHSLGRLRIRDRHSNPLHYPITDSVNTANTAAATATKTIGITSDEPTTSTTLRFEIHRHSQPLKRGSGTDANRLEVELHGHHHTLLDLHRLLVEFGLNASSIRRDEDDGDNAAAVGGVFFIENVFYTCGTDGKKIQESIGNWLAAKDNQEWEAETKNVAEVKAVSSLRREYLGLSSTKMKYAIIPMVEMRLEDLPIRLGVRYFHMFIPPSIPLFQHLLDDPASSPSWCLSTESAVYVTGIHTHIIGSDNKSATLKSEQEETGKEGRHVPPILVHDAWSPPLRHVCHACQRSHASIVTVDDELTDAPPPGLDSEAGRVHLWGVPMCSSCYRALHYRPAAERCREEKADDCSEAASSDGRKGNNKEGDNDGNNMQQHSLELRPGHGPSFVFSIEDYQRMVTSSEYRIIGL